MEDMIMKNTNENSLVQVLVGIVLLAVGLYMLSQRVYIHHGWSVIRFGSFNISSGLVTVPLIIGIIWRFYDPKSMAARILLAVGVIIIIVSLLMSMQISFMRISLFEYILIFGCIGAGCGLLLKNLLKAK